MQPDPDTTPSPKVPAAPSPEEAARPTESAPEVAPSADDPVTAHVAGDDPLPSQPDPTLIWVDFF